MAYLVFLLLLSWPAIAAAAQPLQYPLTAEEQRGQQLFEKGTSARGSKIEASLPGGVRVPASAVPCAGCHGIDGLGRPEGGIVPATLPGMRLLSRMAAFVQTGGRGFLTRTAP